jgi:hypothetical protein
MAEQFDFFAELGQQFTISEDKSESSGFEWSYSRRGVLEQCPRHYYYTYYGASARTAKTEPGKETLRFLKKLSNCFLRSGDIAHLVIRAYLKRLQSGEEWSQERMVRWARDIFQRDLEFSRQYRIGSLLSDTANSPALLLGFYYGYADAAELWANSQEHLVTALANFRTMPTLAPFRFGATREGAVVESPIVLKHEYFSMRGKIDLAFPIDHRFVVVDWKIGDSGNGEESLQLMSYAMAAINRFQCAPDDIDLYRIQLRSGIVSHFEIGGKQILRAKMRIIQDVERMKALDDYGRNAVAEVFTPCGQSRVCAMCPFQVLCPKELRKDDRNEYSDTEARG